MSQSSSDGIRRYKATIAGVLSAAKKVKGDREKIIGVANSDALVTVDVIERIIKANDRGAK